jgi:preprotein translocase subunit SecG
MTTILIVLHVLVCFFLIGIVLLQQGKGADIGATFGGSNQSLFGTEGPLPLLNKITTLAAIIFMATSVSLAYISANKSSGSVMSKLPAQEQQIPAAQAPTVPEAAEATQPVVPVAPSAEAVPPDAPQQQEQSKE